MITTVINCTLPLILFMIVMADFLLSMSGVRFVDLRIPSWDYGPQPGRGMVVPHGGSVVPECRRNRVGVWQTDLQHCRCWTAPPWCRQGQARGWGSLLLFTIEWSQLWASGMDDYRCSLEVFWACSSDRTPQGRPRINWGAYIYLLAWEYLLDLSVRAGGSGGGDECLGLPAETANPGDQIKRREYVTLYFQPVSCIFYTNCFVCS